METLWLRILGANEAGGPEALLREWLDRTSWSDHLAEVEPGDDAAEALLTEGDRRLSVRLHRQAADAWRLETSAWLAPAGPSSGWSRLIGVAVFGVGLAVSLGYLAWSRVAFWIGVAAAGVLGFAATRVARRYGRTDRVTEDDPARARALVDDLAAVLRTDARVTAIGPGP